MNVPDITEIPACQGRLKGLAHFAISVGGAAAVYALTERFRKNGYTVAKDLRRRLLREHNCRSGRKLS